MPPLLLAGCLALFAPLLIGGGESLIIFVGEHDVALKTLILLLAFKYLFAQYSTVASIPGGLLMPILCLGALWGGSGRNCPSRRWPRTGWRPVRCSRMCCSAW